MEAEASPGSTVDSARRRLAINYCEKWYPEERIAEWAETVHMTGVESIPSVSITDSSLQTEESKAFQFVSHNQPAKKKTPVHPKKRRHKADVKCRSDVQLEQQGKFKSHRIKEDAKVAQRKMDRAMRRPEEPSPRQSECDLAQVPKQRYLQRSLRNTDKMPGRKSVQRFFDLAQHYNKSIERRGKIVLSLRRPGIFSKGASSGQLVAEGEKRMDEIREKKALPHKTSHPAKPVCHDCEYQIRALAASQSLVTAELARVKGKLQECQKKDGDEIGAVRRSASPSPAASRSSRDDHSAYSNAVHGRYTKCATEQSRVNPPDTKSPTSITTSESVIELRPELAFNGTRQQQPSNAWRAQHYRSEMPAMPQHSELYHSSPRQEVVCDHAAWQSSPDWEIICEGEGEEARNCEILPGEAYQHDPFTNLDRMMQEGDDEDNQVNYYGDTLYDWNPSRRDSPPAADFQRWDDNADDQLLQDYVPYDEEIGDADFDDMCEDEWLDLDQVDQGMLDEDPTVHLLRSNVTENRIPAQDVIAATAPTAEDLNGFWRPNVL